MLYFLQFEKKIQDEGFEFQWDHHLGYISSCPSNLGTGLRAAVHIRLPNLCQVIPVRTIITQEKTVEVKEEFAIITTLV